MLNHTFGLPIKPEVVPSNGFVCSLLLNHRVNNECRKGSCLIQWPECEEGTVDVPPLSSNGIAFNSNSDLKPTGIHIVTLLPVHDTLETPTSDEIKVSRL